jgi:hypothetical protein
VSETTAESILLLAQYSRRPFGSPIYILLLTMGVGESKRIQTNITDSLWKKEKRNNKLADRKQMVDNTTDFREEKSLLNRGIKIKRKIKAYFFKSKEG